VKFQLAVGNLSILITRNTTAQVVENLKYILIEVNFKFYHPELILHLQGQVLHYLASQCLHLCLFSGRRAGCCVDGLSELHYKCVTDVQKKVNVFNK
jgi:hypothetical protein